MKQQILEFVNGYNGENLQQDLMEFLSAQDALRLANERVELNIVRAQNEHELAVSKVNARLERLKVNSAPPEEVKEPKKKA